MIKISEDFPWHLVFLISLPLFLLVTLTAWVPLPVNLRIARSVIMPLLWLTFTLALWQHIKQDSRRRSRDVTLFLEHLRDQLAGDLEAQQQIQEQLRAQLNRLGDSDGTPEFPGLTIGDTSCRFNAASPLLRCAVNPSGPCEQCPSFESRLN